MRTLKILSLGLFVVGGLVLQDGVIAAPTQGRPVVPGVDIQAILDKGQDLLLQPGRIYPVKSTLKFKVPNQSISTFGATNLSDYAVLRIDEPTCAQLVNGNNQDGVRLERLVLDGNRYQLSSMGLSNEGGAALVHFGGGHVKNQMVRNCVLMSTRSWSSLKFHEGGTGLRAESNIILGAGSDIHGNGRDGRERAPGWGDGITCAARGSVIRDNLIIDPTDGAVVVFGAPGTLVADNVIASISRESLGGVNMVDPLHFYAVPGTTNRTDYGGTVVRDNLFDAFGARIHITIPMGGAVWAPKNLGQILVGASVVNNTIRGGAAAYGLVAHEIDGFTITGNVSTASYSGIAEGKGPKLPPDDPGPFLYTADAVGNSVLQSEFKPAQRHLQHLLRCNHAKPNMLGYKAYTYGEAEARAIVQAAYGEMLGRKPGWREAAYAVKWLNEAKANGDELRRSLMMSREFTSRFGFVPPEELHPYRIQLWLGTLDQVRRDYYGKHGEFPSAKELYGKSLSRICRR
jgi:hypothetical protein